MAHLTRRQRKLRARRAANAFANGHRRPIDLIQPNPGAYDQFREIVAEPDRAPARMLLDPPYRSVQRAMIVEGLSASLGGALPHLSGDIQYLFAREEERLQRSWVERVGGVLLNGVAYDGPRRYSHNDDVELLGRRLEPQPRIGEKMARLLKSPIAKEVPLPRTNEIHESPCEHCPSARNAARGIEDPESTDIKAGSRAYQIESVFRCAWRPEKNCKGYCDFLNVTEADLATRTT